MFVFFSLEKGPGGVQTFIIRFIRRLNESGETALLLSVPGAFICEELDKTQSNYILIDVNTLSKNKLSEYVHEDDVFVSMDISWEYISELRKINPRIIFYVVTGATFVHSRLEDFAGKQGIKKLLDFLNQKNALYFVDYDNYRCPCTYLDCNLSSVKYIPVPVDTYPCNLYSHLNQCQVITYIGRGSDLWKIYPVKKILEDLSNINFKGEFHIITDTVEHFERILSDVKIKSEILIRYQLGLSGEILDDYLKTYSDLHVSMGTSALEGAKLGVPTLLIDSSIKEFPENYKYRWLYDKNTGYSLGRWIELEGIVDGAPIEEILKVINNLDNRKSISENCFCYVNKNHSIQRFYDGMKEAEKLCLLHVNDLYKLNFIPPYVYYMNIGRFVHKKLPWLMIFFKPLVRMTHKYWNLFRK